VFALSATSISGSPLHAFQGITLPLAVLAVQAVQRRDWRRLPNPRVAVGFAVGLVTIPATVFLLEFARTTAAPTTDNANFIARDERLALDYLNKDKDPGGVLSRSYLGAVIPAKTGRRTLVGDCLWSQPNCFPQVNQAQALFDGTLSIRDARQFVAQSGARFVLADCSTPQDLTAVLAPMLVSVQRFGCASVYELGSPSHPEGPLAQSAPDALVRVTRR